MNKEYMELQYLAETSDGVFIGAPLVFNQIISDTDGLTYDLESGTISLLKPGTYYIEWSVMFNSTEWPGELCLETDTGLTIPGIAIAYSNSLNCGTAFLEVTDPLKIRLVNCSAQGELRVQIEENTVTANMTIQLIESIQTSHPLVIPFISKESISAYPIVDLFGETLSLSIIGSGTSGSSLVTKTETGKLRFENINFSGYGQDFLIFPYDVTLIAATSFISNRTQITVHTPEVNISPFVAIALPCDEDERIFEVVDETRIYSESGYHFRSEDYLAGTTLKAMKTGLNVTIPAGTPILRVCGLMSLGEQSIDLFTQLNVNGTMIFEMVY